jgi:predicted nuclease of predicted toxin-antitoxin system
VRLKLDENLPRSATEVFERFGHDCSTALDEGLGGVADVRLADQAARECRMLVTLDRGLGDVRRHPPGTHPGILVIRAVDQRPAALARILRRFLMATDPAQLAGCVAIIEANRIRVRRPA